MMYVFLLMAFSIGASAQHQKKDALETKYEEGKFLALTKEGFHFNEKAPNLAVVDGQNIAPAVKEAKKIEFALPIDFKTGRVALYFCDDAITFCDTQFIDLKAKKSKVTFRPKSEPNRFKGRLNKHGFIQDDFNKAIAEAEKKQQLILIDFSARWCPGCVRYEKEMFGTNEFKKLTADMVKLIIDMDRFENMVIAEKYNIKGMPTLLILNPMQDEIDRIIDFQPIELLSPFLNAIKSEPVTIKELKLLAKDDAAAAYGLAKRLLSSGRAEESLEHFEKVKPEPLEYISAQIKAAQAKYSKDPKQKKPLEKILKSAIKNEPASTRSIQWRSLLAEISDDKDEKSKIKKDGVILADAMLEDNEKLMRGLQGDDVGEFVGFEKMLLAGYRADLVEASGASSEEIQQAWKRAAWIGMDTKIPIQKTGTNIRYLSMLLKAKMLDMAGELITKMLKSDPSNAELQRRRLRVLVELKRYNEAIVLGRRVVKDSYGRNEFWAAESLAEAYVSSNRMREAKVFLNEYLGRNELNWPVMKSSKKTLEDLKAKLPKTE